MHPPSLFGVAARAAALIAFGLAVAAFGLSPHVAWPRELHSFVTLARDSGQWNDIPDHVRQWFKGVRAANGVPCCDIADGHRTQWDIKSDGYWIPNPLNEREWMQVPPEAVVYNAGNPTGDAVVWWVQHPSTNAQEPGIVFIRCFVPGGGV